MIARQKIHIFGVAGLGWRAFEASICYAMKSVRPSGPAEALGIDPSTEEGHVLSRVDQKRSLREIAEMSGLPEDRVDHIVDRLIDRGALARVAPDEPPSRMAMPADESGAYTYQALGAPVAEDEPSGDLFDDDAIPEPYELGYASSFDDGSTIAGDSTRAPALGSDRPSSSSLSSTSSELPGAFGLIAPLPFDSQSRLDDDPNDDDIGFGDTGFAVRAHAEKPENSDDEMPFGAELEEPRDEYAVLADSVAISQDEAQSYAEAFANGLQSQKLQAPAETDPSISEASDEYDSRVDSTPQSQSGSLTESMRPNAEDGAEEGAESSEEAPASATNPKEEEQTDQEVEDERNYRKIYETKFHRLMPDERIALAPRLTGPDLAALCLDLDPK